MTVELVGSPCDGERRKYHKPPTKVFIPRTNNDELRAGLRRDAIYSIDARKLDTGRLYYEGDDVMEVTR